jgi:flagellar biosynthesis chaperone FliJ
MINTERLKRILELIANHPLEAADELDKMADELKKIATRLRQNKARKGEGFRTQGGAQDVVRVNVVGPGREN